MKQSFNVGDRVVVADGYYANGEARPERRGIVRELYGPDNWPRVQFGHDPTYLETCSPRSLRKVRG